MVYKYLALEIALAGEKQYMQKAVIANGQLCLNRLAADTELSFWSARVLVKNDYHQSFQSALVQNDLQI